MLMCQEITFRTWSPFSRGKGKNREDVVWTAISTLGVELANSLEWLEWSNLKSVQVRLCTCCGQPGCGVGNWVSVYRLHDDVVWIAAPRNPDDEYDMHYRAPPDYILEHNSVLFPAHTWRSITERCPRVPLFDSLPELPADELGEL